MALTLKRRLLTINFIRDLLECEKQQLGKHYLFSLQHMNNVPLLKRLNWMLSDVNQRELGLKTVADIDAFLKEHYFGASIEFGLASDHKNAVSNYTVFNHNGPLMVLIEHWG